MLDRPEIFRVHLRAILRASQFGKVRVMFPMVTHLTGLRAAKAMLEEERKKVGVDPIPVGIMVEVPVVAVMADRFAEEVDFFSVGTNDLTQYTLAMDRGHPSLAPYIDGLNPGVLQLIDGAVRAAHRLGKWVGVCGGIASDPQAIPILLGLDVDELSVSAPAIPGIKAQIRLIPMAECRRLASLALRQENATGVRALVPDPLGEEE
jgi:phosphocarrier protein FPr